MFLTREQVEELTGYKKPVCQLRWLVANGVRHWVDRAGRPKIPCSAIDGTSAKPDDAGPDLELGHVA